MKVEFSYGKTNYLLKSDGHCFILQIIKNGKPDTQRNKYFNKIESIFPILLKRALKNSDAKTLKEMQSEIIEFKKWSKDTFKLLDAANKTGKN